MTMINMKTYAIYTCECGQDHDTQFYSGDFDCGCGRLYNLFGQELDSIHGDGSDA